MKTLTCCKDCGSSDIEMRGWVKVNTGEVNDDFDLAMQSDSDIFCCSCDSLKTADNIDKEPRGNFSLYTLDVEASENIEEKTLEPKHLRFFGELQLTCETKDEILSHILFSINDMDVFETQDKFYIIDEISESIVSNSSTKESKGFAPAQENIVKKSIYFESHD